MAAAQYEGPPVGATDFLAVLNSRLDAQDRNSESWRHEVRGEMGSTRDLVQTVSERVAAIETRLNVSDALDAERKRTAADEAERLRETARAAAEALKQHADDVNAAKGRTVSIKTAKWTIAGMIGAAVVSGLGGDLILGYVVR